MEPSKNFKFDHLNLVVKIKVYMFLQIYKIVQDNIDTKLRKFSIFYIKSKVLNAF